MRLRRTAAIAAMALAAVLLGPAPAASAAAGVTVTSSLGAGLVDAEHSTTISVRGSGFQSVQGGFGGVYVLLGWVDPSGWRPSEGGSVGSDYLYIPDSESQSNAGYQRFVSFPGGETESAAQAVLSDDGSWQVEMVVPGPEFTALDRGGNATTVDCLAVQCGVITIGAHGVANATNETFTPLSFVTSGTTAAAPSAGETAAPAASDDSAATPEPAATAAAAVGELRVGVSSASLTAGDAMSFTAGGFAAGEQVVASLDGGVAAVGPLTAGSAGEIAGVLPLPADLAAGTHLLTVAGAATGGSVDAEVTVAANAVATAAVATDHETPAWLTIAMLIAITLAIFLIAANVIVAIVRRSRHPKRKAAAA
ncbi:hypothetical protein [Microbacterium indicum]|uniref:hypothetical protein n=1 Tax=Microbacterium indicum TaxID=358100 RepID=UPI0004078CF9|nr:hypothetical protein [Microbacterium indicum]